MDKRRGWLPVLLATAVLLFTAYAGAYLSLCQPRPYRCPFGIVAVACDYRVNPLGQKGCERLFWPVHQVDRKLRPQVWAETLKL